MPKQFDARHLSSTKAYQAQMTNWYEVQIANLGEDFTLLTQTVNLPDISTPTVEVPFGNSKAKVAGQVEYADGTITLVDAIVKDMEKQILAWQKQVYNPETGKMGWVNEYKKDMTVTQYGPDGTQERVWKFEGVWPSQVTYGEMSYENSDKKVISLTLSYDRAYRSK